MPEAVDIESVLLGRQADVIDEAERSRSEVRALLDSRSDAVRIRTLIDSSHFILPTLFISMLYPVCNSPDLLR